MSRFVINDLLVRSLLSARDFFVFRGSVIKVSLVGSCMVMSEVAVVVMMGMRHF